MYSINGYDFQNEEDVDIAREELNKIQYISEKLSDDPEAVLTVYNKMLDSKIFLTAVGVEYLRKLQEYLLKSTEIDDSRVRDVPILISYQDALHAKELSEALLSSGPKRPEKKKTEPETPSEKLKRRYKFSIATIVVLCVVIGAMFVIALMSDTPNILNYRTELENEYAQWAQELSEKEAELREREQALEGQ